MRRVHSLLWSSLIVATLVACKDETAKRQQATSGAGADKTLDAKTSPTPAPAPDTGKAGKSDDKDDAKDDGKEAGKAGGKDDDGKDPYDPKENGKGGKSPNQNDPGQNGPQNPMPSPGPNNPGQNPPDGPTVDPTPDGKVPIAAHLINYFPGTCRRLVINGDASSTETVTGTNCKTVENLTEKHDWWSAKDFGMPVALVKGHVFKNQTTAPLPKGGTFPVLDFEALKPKVSGTLRATAVAVSSWHTDLSPAENIVAKVERNLVVVGSKTSPILINGDVLVVGDLVIKGWFQGAGTIYVTGNVYMPHDVYASNGAFPFSDDKAIAGAEGKKRVANGTDALGLVAGGYVFAGDNYPLYQNAILNAQVQAMYAWYPGGKKGYKALHEPVWNCQANKYPAAYVKAKWDECECHIHGGFNQIDANLYAKLGVYGSSGSWLNPTTYVPNSFAINGTVVTNYFDVVTTPELCTGPTTAHPVHKRQQGWSYLSLDYRLMHGVKSMSHVKPFYKH